MGLKEKINKNQEIGKGIEEVLTELREKQGWSRIELVEKLGVYTLTEKDIKKWETGLKYPDLDMIYRLAEVYQVSSTELIQAKNNSYEKGMAGVDANVIKWVSYGLNISFRMATVITILIYVAALVGAFLFFLTMASNFIASH